MTGFTNEFKMCIRYEWNPFSENFNTGPYWNTQNYRRSSTNLAGKFFIFHYIYLIFI